MARILIAEDDPVSREILKDILTEAGHHVLEAKNGHEAVALYREHHPELLMSDINMPGKEGLETFRELFFDFPDMRLIAFSGGSSITERPHIKLEFAENYGAVSSFTKPFERDEVLRHVEAALKQGKRENRSA